jgi:hypothetical protein
VEGYAGWRYVTEELAAAGTTLRGLLLNAYAFWQIGQIALIAAIVAFVAAFLMLILAGLGFWHWRRTPAETQLLGGGQRA